jgi:hypothetical protein
MRVSPDAPSLEQVLASVVFQRNNAPPKRNAATMESFLFPEKGLFYLASNWLAGTPRQVLYRAAMLGDLHGSHESDWGEGMLRRINEDVRRELLESGHVDPDWRKRILEVLDDRVALRFNFHGTFTIEMEIGRVQIVTSEEITLKCRFPRGYQWRIREIRGGDEASRSSFGFGADRSPAVSLVE